MNDKRSTRILVVDDEPSICLALEREIQDLGHEVDTAADATQAMKKIRENEYDIVLTDNRMPGMTGIELLEWIKQSKPGIDVIMMTAFASIKSAASAVRLGAFDYLLKPFGGIELLRATLDRAIQKRNLEEDIQKRAKELRLCMASFRSIVQKSADGIIITDQKGMVRYVNLAAESMLGRKDLLGDVFGLPVSGEEIRELDVILDKGNPGTAEMRVFETDWEGEKAFLISFHDITARRQAEQRSQESNQRLEEALEELKKTQQQVIQQERLTALGQMASGIAHDFNNALMPIMGFADILLVSPKVLDDKDKVRRLVQMIHTSANDAAKVVRQLQDFYRRRTETEEFSMVDLNDLVRQAISLTEPRWKGQAQAKGTEIHIEAIHGQIPETAGDEANLREMLINLIFNALDAMPEGGAITVRTRGEDDSILLEVADAGTGMTESVRLRCLEPFFSTKGGRGTGLGLSMVFGTIERHNGTIDVQSELGKGTTVTVRLPVKVLEPVEKKQRPEKKSTRFLRILMVEDEDPVREVISRFLSLDKHEVETAKNGHEGFKKFEQGKFDLVITDRAMPKMNGDQLAILIKEASPDMPIIMLTGFGDMLEDEEDGKPREVDFLLGKPISSGALQDAIATVMGT